MKKFRLGLIINPYAGVGGSVGLKGSDGEDIRQEAFARGAQMQAPHRVSRCLQMLELYKNQIDIFCYAGIMGEDTVNQLSFDYTLVGEAKSAPSNAQDTGNAVRKLLEFNLDILLFAGGDGTARDIADALQSVNAQRQVVLGIPAGVKMHSGVYAITPEAAGEILLCLLNKKLVDVQSCDVRDIDENSFRDGKVKTQLYGDMLVPILPQFIQQVKNSGAEQSELAKVDIANYLVDNLEDNVLYIVGPGSTTQAFLEQLGLSGTLLGVDAILDSVLIGKDLDANKLYEIIQTHIGKVKLIITAIGGQGHIIGRGNQQLTPEVLYAIGRNNIQIIATRDKIFSLHGRPFLVDSNDPEFDKEFAGYQSVLVGYDEMVLYPVGFGQPDTFFHE